MKKHNSFKAVGLFAAIAVIAVAALGGATTADAAYKPTNFIKAELENGVNSAMQSDNDCRTGLNAGYRNSYFTSSGGGDLRTGVNENAYRPNIWLSLRGKGNTTAPISVNYGTTTIPLQINDLIFLCGTMVETDRGSVAGGCRTTLSGQMLVSDTSRWVTSESNANDRRPNSFGAGCMHPSKSFSVRKLLPPLAVASDWGGTATLDNTTTQNCGDGNSGTTCAIVKRDEDSRYWMASPVNVTYKTAPSTPITSSGKLTVGFDFQYYNAYQSTIEKKATKICANGGPSATNAWLDITRCGVGHIELVISVVLNYNYNLLPQVAVSPSIVREGDANIHVVGSVNNNGTTASENVNWTVSRFVLAPGTNYAKSGTPNAACTQFSGYAVGSCTVARSGANPFSTGNGVVSTFDNDMSGLPPGSRICYVTSVDKGGSAAAAPTWRHSNVACSTVQRIPFVQVLGNDLRVGSTFTGAGTNINAGAKSFVFNNAGSWSEYAILAPGNVANIASQSGAKGGNAGLQSTWSGLTFANTGSLPGCVSGAGCFTSATNMGKIPSVDSFVRTARYNGAALNYDRGTSSFNTSGIGGIIPGANLSSFSQSASITTTGDITIDSDIIYNSGTLRTVGEIPQLILIGNNINIRGNVKRIDAWLIATNTLNTCSDVSQANIRSNNCSNQLTVNGAIMANRLLLDRTYYSSSAPEQPAESLNLRGDSYIWASGTARQNGQWQTVYSTDLPPRY